MGKKQIPQHEPLRVPQGWTEQARAFVIQLERIIDRIYAYVSGVFTRHDEEIDKVNTKINNRMFPIERGTVHTSSVDFNDFLSNGIHTFYQNGVVAGCSNAPCGYAGRLCVWVNNGEEIAGTWMYGEQIYYDIYGNVYIRGIRTAETSDITFDAWHKLPSSEKTTRPTVISCATVDAIKTALTTMVGNMKDGEIRKSVINVTANLTEFSGGYWTFEITRTTASYFSGYAYSYNNTRGIVEVIYTNGTWEFYSERLSKAGSKLINEYFSSMSFSKTYNTLGNSGFYLLVVTSYSSANTSCYMGLVLTQGSGDVTIKPINTSSEFTVTSSAKNSITVSSTLPYCQLLLISLQN